MNEPDDSHWQQQSCIDLLKLEYETLATRYDNIYKALWQNFSFISVVAAGILTFGSAALQPWAALVVAGLPFVFWYFVTFRPLDRYGNDARARLGQIEAALNAIVPDLNMHAFIGFNQTASNKPSWGKYRVVEAMNVAVLVGFAIWITMIILAVKHPHWFVKPPSPTVFKS